MSRINLSRDAEHLKSPYMSAVPAIRSCLGTNVPQDVPQDCLAR